MPRINDSITEGQSTKLAAEAIRELCSVVGEQNVLWHPSDLMVYECDGYTIAKHRPDAVVFPSDTQQVAAVARICHRHKIPMLPRGAGTSLAGGCVPLGGGLVIMLTRMTRILEIDLRNRFAVVEAGVRNTQLARALVGSGYHFAPDPSSQTASTIGGNVATNAGGPHTLKYGVTVNHVLGVEAVLADGSIVQHGPVVDPGMLDLCGVLTGSEGTLAIVTKIWVRLTPLPSALRTLRVAFPTVEDATEAVSEIIAAGLIPAALELMDRGILEAVEAAFQFGFPLDVGAVLVIELDGEEASLEEELQITRRICERWNAREILLANSPEERERLWKCRKSAVAAVGRLSPSYCIQDGVVPRTKLPQIVKKVQKISQEFNIRIVNVAHAGDGNIHPIFLFDEREPAQVDRVLEAGRQVLEECIALGGSITAEHGVGVEKLHLMREQYRPEDLTAMRRLREAFNPDGLLTPGKLVPDERSLEWLGTYPRIGGAP